MADGLRFDELDGEVEEAPGLVRTAWRHLRQGINPLWDEATGAVGAVRDTSQQVWGSGEVASPDDFLGHYRRNRDESRLEDDLGAAAHPATAGVSRFAGALAGGVAMGGAGAVGRGLMGAATAGATQGAASALGESRADLTTWDAGEYARAGLDAAQGAAFGAGAGGLGYGAGRLVQAVGERAGRALRGARGELLDEVRGARAAEDDALRAAEAEREVKLGKAHAQALGMDQKLAQQQARDAARGAGGGGGRHSPLDPNADPDTRVLDGYGRGARKLRKDNAREVHDARQRLQAEDVSPAERAELEEYLRGHGDAVENPVAFRLRSIEENLRKRYSPEVVRRAMARFDAQGNAISRSRLQQQAAPEPQQRLLPEQTVTRPMDYGDVARQGRSSEVARMGGGGRALGGLDARRGMDDAFHDAKTRVALRPVQPTGRSTHEFEFVDPASKREYVVKLTPSDMDPEALVLDIIRPKDMSTPVAITGGWQQAKNTVGPSVVKQVYAELARAFPDVKRITAYRATGWNRGRDLTMDLPEVTRAGSPDFKPDLYSDGPDGRLYRDWPEREATAPEAWPRGMDGDADDATAALGYEDVARQGRAEDILPQGGGGRSAFAERLPEAEEVTRPSLPPPEPVQRTAPLAAMPSLRPGASRQNAWGGRRLPAYVEDVRTTLDDGGFSPLPVDEALAYRRALGAEARAGSATPEPTRGARPAAMAEDSMRSPEDAAPLAEEATRATSVPQVPRRAPSTPPREVRMDGATRYAPPPIEQRLAARPGPEELAMKREKDALAAVGVAGYEGARRAHNFVAAPIGAAMGIARESLKNPAVRARAISMFKLERLAEVRPDVWAKVGAALQRAQEKGSERFAATRHALLLTNQGFREAEAQLDAELQGLDDEALAERLSAR